MITDGEFRRAYWHLDFMWGFNGVKEIELEHGYKFVGQEQRQVPSPLLAKLREQTTHSLNISNL